MAKTFFPRGAQPCLQLSVIDALNFEDVYAKYHNGYEVIIRKIPNPSFTIELPADFVNLTRPANVSF